MTKCYMERFTNFPLISCGVLVYSHHSHTSTCFSAAAGSSFQSTLQYLSSTKRQTKLASTVGDEQRGAFSYYRVN